MKYLHPHPRPAGMLDETALKTFRSDYARCHAQAIEKAIQDVCCAEKPTPAMLKRLAYHVEHVSGSKSVLNLLEQGKSQDVPAVIDYMKAQMKTFGFDLNRSSSDTLSY